MIPEWFAVLVGITLYVMGFALGASIYAPDDHPFWSGWRDAWSLGPLRRWWNRRDA